MLTELKTQNRGKSARKARPFSTRARASARHGLHARGRDAVGVDEQSVSLDPDTGRTSVRSVTGSVSPIIAGSKPPRRNRPSRVSSPGPERGVFGRQAPPRGELRRRSRPAPAGASRSGSRGGPGVHLPRRRRVGGVLAATHDPAQGDGTRQGWHRKRRAASDGGDQARLVFLRGDARAPDAPRGRRRALAEELSVLEGGRDFGHESRFSHKSQATKRRPRWRRRGVLVFDLERLHFVLETLGMTVCGRPLLRARVRRPRRRVRRGERCGGTTTEGGNGRRRREGGGRRRRGSRWPAETRSPRRRRRARGGVGRGAARE